MLVKCLELGSKKKESILPVIIKWFDASPISEANEFFFFFIIDRKSKHANEVMDHFCSPLFIGMKDHFCVAVRFECMAQCFQDLSDFRKIIDLTIICDPK